MNAEIPDTERADLLAVLAKHRHFVRFTTRDLTDEEAGLRTTASAPWFSGEERWSARRVFLHIIGETAQHSGHADIIRESLDGAKSMG